MSASEIAALRQRIDQEIISSQLGLNGYAEVARHEVITNHYNALGAYIDELKTYVGNQKAQEIVAEALEQHLSPCREEP